MANCWSCRNQGSTCIACIKGALYWYSLKRWIKARAFYLWEDVKLVCKAIMEEYFG